MKKLIVILMAAAMLLTLTACGGADSGIEDGVLTIGMECAYAPYNWAQPDDSNGAVPISNVSGSYANGYDVLIAKKICEANDWELEIKMMDWDSLVPAVMTGEIDCAIAGQSMTAERQEKVDFAGPYLYASIVCLTRQDSPLASAGGKTDLSGKCTSQRGTIWYDTCLPQIPDAQIMPAQDTAPTMLMALATGAVDFVCTDMPTAQGALIAYPELTILNFTGTHDDFEVSEEEINIGISIRKGNTELQEAMNKVLHEMHAEDFNDIMGQAVRIQPID